MKKLILILLLMASGCTHVDYSILPPTSESSNDSELTPLTLVEVKF